MRNPNQTFLLLLATFGFSFTLVANALELRIGDPGGAEAVSEVLDEWREAAGQEKVVVRFAPGFHHFKQLVEIGPELGGTAEHPVRIIGETGAVLSAGAPLASTGWKKESGSEWKYGLADADLPFKPDRLFIGGKLMTVARYPNLEPDRAGEIYGGTAADCLSPDRVRRWSAPAGGHLFALHKNRWGDMTFEITGANGPGRVHMKGGWQNNRPSPPHAKFRYVEGIREELDSPGECFVDPVNPRMLLIPSGPPPDQLETVVTGLPGLLRIVGTDSNPVRHVHVENLVFAHTARTFMETKEPLLRSDWRFYRGGALLFENARDCEVVGCTFRDLGGNAVVFSGHNRDHVVRGCQIRDVGASGVSFVGRPSAVRGPLFHYSEFTPLDQLDRTPGPKSEAYPKDCKVEDCLIEDIGRVEKQTAGVQISMAENITVAHCTIRRVPRAGINVSDGTWGGHLIEWNDVYDTVLETSDHGAFNSWGRDRFWYPNSKFMATVLKNNPGLHTLDARSTTVIRNNRFQCAHGWDIDLDDGSSNYHIHHNLCMQGGIKLREGFDRLVENNVTLNNTIHPHVWFEESQDVMRGNLLFDAYRVIRCPRPLGKEADRNFIHTDDDSALRKLRILSGRDTSSAAGDAGFVDLEGGDFRLRADSRAKALGAGGAPLRGFGWRKLP